MTEAPAPSAITDGARLSRRGVERLDLLLLAIEALDLNGGEAMVWTSQQMGLQAQFPNRVELWKRRCHNPLRRTTRRDQLDPVDAESLICLVCAMADRLSGCSTSSCRAANLNSSPNSAGSCSTSVCAT